MLQWSLKIVWWSKVQQMRFNKYMMPYRLLEYYRVKATSLYDWSMTQAFSLNFWSMLPIRREDCCWSSSAICNCFSNSPKMHCCFSCWCCCVSFSTSVVVHGSVKSSFGLLLMIDEAIHISPRNLLSSVFLICIHFFHSVFIFFILC